MFPLQSHKGHPWPSWGCGPGLNGGRACIGHSFRRNESRLGWVASLVLGPVLQLGREPEAQPPPPLELEPEPELEHLLGPFWARFQPFSAILAHFGPVSPGSWDRDGVQHGPQTGQK